MAQEIRRHDAMRPLEVRELMVPEAMAHRAVVEEHDRLALAVVDEPQPVLSLLHGVHRTLPASIQHRIQDTSVS